jgi:hypothetical protein
VNTGKRAVGILCCFFALFFLLSSCDAEEEPPRQEALKYSIEKLNSLDRFSLDKGEKIGIFDVDGQSMAIQISKKLEEDHPSFSEVSFMELTKSILWYDAQEEMTRLDYEFEEPVYCQYAQFFGEGILFLVIDQSTVNHVQPYDIMYLDETLENPISVFQASCEVGLRTIPHLIALDRDRAVFSYYDPLTATFGVKTIDVSLQIHDLIELQQSESTFHLSTALSENGTELIYFAAIEGKGMFYIANFDEVLHTIPLLDEERVYDYCMLGDKILQTIELEDTSKVYRIKDFEGNLLLESPMKTQIYRMVSNGENIVAGNSRGYVSYVLDASMQIELISLPQLPRSSMFFYRIDRQKFLIHFTPGSSGGKGTVYLLSLEP